MRVQPSRFVFAFFILVVSLHYKLYAQTATSGGLTGVVTDATGAVLPGADVEIRDHNKGTTLSTRTDRQGGYGFFFLWPGRYILTVAHAGFRTKKLDLNVLLGPPVSVSVALEIAQTSTSVAVTAEAPLLHAENGDVSATVNQKQISEVPNPGNDLNCGATRASVLLRDKVTPQHGHMVIVAIFGLPFYKRLDSRGMAQLPVKQGTGASSSWLVLARDAQPLPVFDGSLAFLFGSLKRPCNGRVQPPLLAQEAVCAVLPAESQSDHWRGPSFGASPVCCSPRTISHSTGAVVRFGGDYKNLSVVRAPGPRSPRRQFLLAVHREKTDIVYAGSQMSGSRVPTAARRHIAAAF